MSRRPRLSAGLIAPALVLAGSWSAPAGAIRFELGEAIEGSWSNSFTIGASWRMQDRHSNLVGKSNLDPTLCTTEARCIGTQDAPPTDEQLEYLGAPGIYSINGDDGNLNFEKGDIVASASKLTSDLSLNWGDYGLFARGYFYFDSTYAEFQEFHPNRANGPTPADRGPETLPWPGELRDEIGVGARLMDGYLYSDFTVFEDYDVYWKVGNVLVNWGESTFVVINSINTINPPLESRIFVPGFDIKEVFEPVPMVHLSSTLTDTISWEGYYELSWRRLRTAPPGSFFATGDIGVPGGTFASLPYASNAEDPNQLERIQGPQNLIETFDLTRTSLSILRGADRTPRKDGQFGTSVKWFAEDWGNTEFGFYFVNYHSRLPYASLTAAYRSCLRPEDGSEPDQLDLQNCSNVGPGGGTAALTRQEKFEQGRDLLPVDSVEAFLEYPEDVQLYGISFNTNIGDFAIQGEYAFRPALPVQVDLEDLADAALQPAFPREDTELTELLTGLPPAPGQEVIIPGDGTAVPDLVETGFRGNPEVQPRQYIRGWEELEVGQLDAAVTYVLGPGNWFFADQVILLGEVGMTHILSLPSSNEIVFEGPGTDTAPLPGRVDLDSQLPINPEQQRDGYVTDLAWGYRLLVIPSYKAILDKFTVEPFITFFHDVSGVGPGPGAMFVEGRKEVNLLMNVIYQSYRLIGGYTWYTGGNEFNLRRDRDFASLALRYEF